MEKGFSKIEKRRIHNFGFGTYNQIKRDTFFWHETLVMSNSLCDLQKHVIIDNNDASSKIVKITLKSITILIIHV